MDSSFSIEHSNFSNTTDSATIIPPYFLPQLQIMVRVVLPFLFVGSIGNLITVHFLLFTASKQQPLNLLILNQMIADLILSAIVYPANALAVVSQYRATGVIILIFSTVFIVCQSSVMFSILFISINRVIAVVFYTKCSSKVRLWLSIVGICASWICPLLLTIPILTGRTPDIVFDSGDLYPMGTAVPADKTKSHGYQQYTIFCVLLCVILPSIGTIICYVSVWVSVRRRRDRVGHEHHLAGTFTNLDKILVKRIHTTKLSGLITICFFITYYPFTLSIIERHGLVPSEAETGRVGILMLLIFCLWSGCCINPLLFGFLNLKFQAWFLDLFRRKQRASVSMSTTNKQIPTSTVCFSCHRDGHDHRVRVSSLNSDLH